MLRESQSADRPKGSGHFNESSGPSMCRLSFSQIITRQKAYAMGGGDEKTTMGCLREKDGLMGSR